MVKREKMRISYCKDYRALAIRAINNIQAKWRLQQIYTITKRMAEAEGVDFDLQKEEEDVSDCEEYCNEIEKLVEQIKDKERLIRVYSFVRRSLQIENESK